jgi:LytR cell envelope-related transcriptional attenuator
MWNGLTTRLRTLITLAVLAVLLLIGVTWGWSQVIRPLPGKADAAICVPTSYAAGGELFVQDVTVSVLNASKREGLAGRTLQLFEEAGFAAGQTSNAPPGTEVAVAEVWVSDPESPAAKLVRARLGPVTVRTEPNNSAVGVTVVVGDGFGELQEGPGSVPLQADAVVCSPPVD